jgi:hypothetical protein
VALARISALAALLDLKDTAAQQTMLPTLRKQIEEAIEEATAVLTDIRELASRL